MPVVISRIPLQAFVESMVGELIKSNKDGLGLTVNDNEMHIQFLERLMKTNALTKLREPTRAVKL